MREIKFRGYDRRSNSMFPVHSMDFGKISNELEGFYGVDIHHKDSDHQGDVSFGGRVGKRTGNPLLPRYELMQYTGLKDRIGKEIYEGDIVKIHADLRYRDMPEKVGTVGFEDGSYRIETEMASHYRWMDYEVEVIGAIYTHPLLGSEKE